MFKTALLSVFVAVAVADVSHLTLSRYPTQPQPLRSQPAPGQFVAIRRQTSDISPDGNYQWSYETDNGIAAEEKGQVVQINGEEAILRVEGSSRHTSPEGEQVGLTYIADENGFQPSGSHIPTPPPVPEPIQRALNWIQSQPVQPEQPQQPQRRFR